MIRSATQSVFSYGMEGHNLLSETTRNLSTSALSTTEHIYLPTASGPMPVAVVINGVHYAVHSDHLNTPRRLIDANKVVKWQWPYSGFGEIAPQATPATGQAAISYSLRYPGQIDDGNGLFYNWNRFYDPRVGRYTQADPIGLEGGWNRFGYVGGNPLGFVDPSGLFVPLVIPGVCAAGGCEAAAALLGAGALWWADNNPFKSPSPIPPSAPMESRRSGKERATDTPSFAKGKKKEPGEDCDTFARRVLKDNYGEGHPKLAERHPGSEYSKIKKNCERGDCS